jgi:vitamin B12 transporter
MSRSRFFCTPPITHSFLSNTFVSAVFAAGLSATATAAQANEASSNQIEDEIVVTAFRLPTDLDKTGTSIYLLTAEQMKQRGFVYLTDALMSVPGVSINQNGPFGGQASARIRGASTGQTLVLLDGIVINENSTPGGGFDFGTIELGDIERIEVLKGSQSTLWGSDAIGGVINIVSKAPSQKLSGEVGSTFGSFGTAQYRAAVSGGNQVADFRLSYSDTSSDGISKADEDDNNPEEDAYDARTLSAALGFNLPGDARLQIHHRQTDTDSEFDSFGNATGVQDGDELSKVERRTSQVRLTVPAFDGRLTNTLVYGESETERDSFTGGVFSFGSEGERDVFQYQGVYTLSDNQQLSLGYEDEDSEANGDDSDIQGIYALYQISAVDTLTLTMGLRRDDHSEFGAETVGRISAAWAFSPALNLHASWGEGFKAPTIFQTTFFCCGATAPNPDLVAETSDSFDIGFDWRFNERGRLAMTYFDKEVENQIDFSFAVGGYENIAEVDAKGVELIFDYRFTDTVMASTNLAYTDSEDINGDELIRIPELTADLSLSWQIAANLRTSLAVIYNGDEEDARGTVDSWTRVDLSGTWQPSEHIEVFARLENLTDRDYQQVFGYGTPERSAYLGLSYNF